MEYCKPPLNHKELSAKLLNRGLVAKESDLNEFLRHVNYYRVTGYLYPFRQSDESYIPGTDLTTVKRIYTFDQKLRNLLLSAIDKIEVSIKSSIAYTFAHAVCPFGYMKKNNLPGITDDAYESLLTRLEDEKTKSREDFIEHFTLKYGDCHNLPPIWMAVEIMSFGTSVSFYRGLSKQLKQKIGWIYGVPDVVFQSWFVGLNSIRNVCAHHGRLFNRRLGYRFLLPNKRKHPDWHTPIAIPNDISFTALTICSYFLDIIGQPNSFKRDVIELFQEHQDIDLIKGTFPANWQSSPLWKATDQSRGTT
jgi:abortive infection bacteriophage resistance protein